MPTNGSSSYDFAVIGAGIVGLSTALALAEADPGARVVVLDKEDGIARHQSGRNSGVIHSGIYYAPGSFKATFCKVARRSMVEFCQEHGVAHDVCGKVIVATDVAELPGLRRLLDRGIENGLKVEPLGPDGVADHEPHVAAVGGIWVPETGVVDFVGVCETYARLLQERGGELRLGRAVTGIEPDGDANVVVAGDDEIRARMVVNCGGLHSDRLALLAGVEPPARIIPFRGEYYDLAERAHHLVRGLIYPVPDPAFPFLGVHLTRSIEGHVHAGPNAVVALRREGYRWGEASARDLADIVTYRGFWRLAARHGRSGMGEVVRSLRKEAFVRSVQRLVPAIDGDDLTPAPSGVRAQAIEPDGSLVDDFLIVFGERSVHVLNAPSPAATASLEIGRMIAERVPARAAL